MTRENYLAHLNAKHSDFIGKIVNMTIREFGNNEVFTFNRIYFLGFEPDLESEDDLKLNFKLLIRQMNGSLLLVDSDKVLTSDVMDFDSIIFEKYSRKSEEATAEA